MTKKISSTKPCGRNSKIYNGAFLKCFSMLDFIRNKTLTAMMKPCIVKPPTLALKKNLEGHNAFGSFVRPCVHPCVAHFVPTVFFES